MNVYSGGVGEHRGHLGDVLDPQRLEHEPAVTQVDGVEVTARTSCTNSVSRVSWSGSVSGRTPCPRLNTWPLAARPASMISAARAVITSVGANTRVGSRLPCTARSPDQRDRVGERRTPVDAHDVGAGLGHQARAARRCRRRSGCAARRARRRRRAPRPSAAAPSGGSRPASARRPTSRRAGPPRRRPRPARAGTPRRCRRSWPSSASQTSGAPYIIALVSAWSFDGPALDEVRRDRERRAGEADQRGRARARRPAR